MEMTAEELALYRELQPLFREKTVPLYRDNPVGSTSTCGERKEQRSENSYDEMA